MEQQEEEREEVRRLLAKAELLCQVIGAYQSKDRTRLPLKVCNASFDSGIIPCFFHMLDTGLMEIMYGDNPSYSLSMHQKIYNQTIFFDEGGRGSDLIYNS